MRYTFLACLALCPALVGQLRTLPTGYQARPGEYSTGTGVTYPFGRSVNFAYQEVHSSWNGTTQAPLTAIGFRRAPRRAANATALAHTVDATITMGPGNLPGFTNTFATNFTGTATVTMATRTVNMPDWTQPFVPEYLFSIWMPLDAPYVVDTTQDFVWDLLLMNSTLPNVSSSLYYSDRTSTTSATGFVLGTGCIATGQTSPVALTTSFTNNTTTGLMGLTFGGSNFPASVPGVLHLGLTNLNLPFPGLCGTVHASPDVAIPIGPTGATGTLTSTSITFPFQASLLNAYFYTQALAPDAGQAGLPLVLSNAREGGFPPGSTFKYIYSLTPPALTGSGPFTAGSVISAYQ